MPQVSGNFGPIQQSVTLDVTGSGVVSFQPNGSNVRITNCFAQVSTATNQATVTFYKGQISDARAISNSPSGSTGTRLSGNVDLFDGETMYVVWSGGDAGSTATATFTGKQIPFDEISETSVEWSAPIAAGDGSLIFPAIKSPDYTAGISGWKIDRDGSAEFNDVDIRGTLRLDGGDNSYVAIVAEFNQPRIELQPEDASGVTWSEPATIRGTYAFTSTPGVYAPLLVLTSPVEQTQNEYAEVRIYGEYTDGTEEPSVDMFGSAGRFRLNVEGSVYTEDLFVENVDGVYRWVNGVAVTSNSAAIGTTETTIATVPSMTYKAGYTYELVYSSLFNVSASPNRPIFRVRQNLLSSVIRTANFPAVNVGQNTSEFRCKFRVGASDVTTSLIVTLEGGAAFNVTMLAAPCFVDVFRLGPSTNGGNSSANTIT